MSFAISIAQRVAAGASLLLAIAEHRSKLSLLANAARNLQWARVRLVLHDVRTHAIYRLAQDAWREALRLEEEAAIRVTDAKRRYRELA